MRSSVAKTSILYLVLNSAAKWFTKVAEAGINRTTRGGDFTPKGERWFLDCTGLDETEDVQGLHGCCEGIGKSGGRGGSREELEGDDSWNVADPVMRSSL
jgi:hypothetical protein